MKLFLGGEGVGSAIVARFGGFAGVRLAQGSVRCVRLRDLGESFELGVVPLALEVWCLLWQNKLD